MLPRGGFGPSLLYAGNLVLTERETFDPELKIPNNKNCQWSKSMGSRGCKPGQFENIHGVTVCHATGNVYVVDATINCRVQVLTKDLQFMFEFGNPEMFESPTNVMCSKEKVYVTDQHCVLVTDL